MLPQKDSHTKRFPFPTWCIHSIIYRFDLCREMYGKTNKDRIYFFSFSNREFLENLRHSPNLFFYKSAFVAPNWDRSAVEVIFWLERKTKLGHRWRNGGVDLCRKFLAAVCQPLANFYSSVTDLWWRNSISDSDSEHKRYVFRDLCVKIPKKYIKENCVKIFK